MTRIAVLSDVHGNAVALEAAVREIEAVSPDLIWFLGDAVVFGPNPCESLAGIRDLSPDITIEGNTDRYLREEAWRDENLPTPIRRALECCRDALGEPERTQLASFRRDVSVTVDGVRFHLCHGAPGNDETRLAADVEASEVETHLSSVDADVVLCGHTHIPWDTTAGETRLLNDGSVGYPFDGDTRGAWLSLETGSGQLRTVEFHRFDYDREETIRRIQATGEPFVEVLVNRLRTGRA